MSIQTKDDIMRLINCTEYVDDLYQASCTHEQKAHDLQWAWLMDMASRGNKIIPFVMLMGLAR